VWSVPSISVAVLVPDRVKTILNCFSLQHSEFKTKYLKVSLDSIFLQIILLLDPTDNPTLMKKLVYKCFYSAVWSHQCFLNDHKDMEMMFVAYYTDRWAGNYPKKICKGVVFKGLRHIRSV
jgi:hypothetical protein